jgi:F0F1-type ATP synthase assembly protein I
MPEAGGKPRPQETGRATAEAMAWVSRITSVGLSLVVPVAAGYGIGWFFGSTVWGLLVGTLLGLVAAGTQFASLMRDLASKSGK